jgi:hypothetical protein
MNTIHEAELELQTDIGTASLPATVQASQVALQATPANILERAYMGGADPATLVKLLELQQKWEADQARKAFVAAMAQFKQNPPEIIKDKLVSFEDRNNQLTSYYHATLAAVVSAAIQGLAGVGISHSWKVDQADGTIAVT